MNLSALPPELIDEVLKHLDGISLAKSRQVCRLWLSLHDQPKFQLLWKRACIEDIPQDILAELTGRKDIFAERCALRADEENKDATVRTDEHGIKWKSLYQEWYRSRHIGKWPCLINELTGHRGPVWDAQFSGEKVITCGEDGTIRIWDSWTRYCLTVLSGHLAGVLSISLRQTPDSSLHSQLPHDLIISGSKDNAVKVWSLENTGRCLHTLHGHTLCVNCVAVEGNIVASASDDSSVKLWDLTKGVCLHTLSNLGDWAKFVCLWQDVLLTVADNSFLSLRSASSGESVSSIKLLDTRRVHSALPPTPGVQGAVLRGQASLVITHSDGLYIWEQKSSSDGSLCGSIVYNFALTGQNTHVQRGECLTMRGPLVAIGTRSGSVFVYHIHGKWENQFQQVHFVIPGNKASVNAVALGDDGEGPSLLTAGEDGVVRIYRWFPPSTLDS